MKEERFSISLSNAHLSCKEKRIGEINKIEIVRSVKVIKISIKVKARHIIFPQKREHYGRVCEKCKFGMFKFSSVIEKLAH